MYDEQLALWAKRLDGLLKAADKIRWAAGRPSWPYIHPGMPAKEDILKGHKNAATYNH